jgi:hypothetical protein
MESLRGRNRNFVHTCAEAVQDESSLWKEMEKAG